MTVNIPRPWHFTDFLATMGLGFSMDFLYFVFGTPLRRLGSRWLRFLIKHANYPKVSLQHHNKISKKDHPYKKGYFSRKVTKSHKKKNAKCWFVNDVRLGKRKKFERIYLMKWRA